MDELTAQSSAAAIGKMVHRQRLQLVLLATHRASVVPFLCADWVVVLEGSQGGARPLLHWNPLTPTDRKPRVHIDAGGLQRFVAGPGGRWAGQRDSGVSCCSQERQGARGRDALIFIGDAPPQRPLVLQSQVQLDEAVRAAASAFDYEFDGRAAFELYPIPMDRLQVGWRVGAIVGPSGSGKSSLLRRTFSNLGGILGGLRCVRLHQCTFQRLQYGLRCGLKCVWLH